MKKLVIVALITLGLVAFIPLCRLAYVGYVVTANKRSFKTVNDFLCTQFPVPSQTNLVKEWNHNISVAQYKVAPFVYRNSTEWYKFILLEMEDNENNRQKVESWAFYEELSNFYKDHINTAGFFFPEGGLAGDFKGQMRFKVKANDHKHFIYADVFKKAIFRKWSQGRTRMTTTFYYFPPEICPGRRLNVFGCTTFFIPKNFKDTLLLGISIRLNGSGFTDVPKEIQRGQYLPLLKNER